MTSNVLIGIATCHQYRARAQSQRETWAKDIEGSHLRFFLGGGEPQSSDEVILYDVDDGYLGLPAKTKEICKWALEHGYTHLFKCDDDTYVQPERLLASGFEKFDYVGRVRGPSGLWKSPYCSGFAYWLSAKAMKIVANAEFNEDEAEDRWVGNVLGEQGIWGEPDYRYVVVNSGRNAISGKEPPRKGNRVIAACEFTPDQMHEVHQQWIDKPSEIKARVFPTGSLSRVAVLVKTFLRDGYLFRCLQGLEKLFPETKIVVVDDGYEERYKITEYARLRELGHVCIWLPFDSGFGAKANAGIPHVQDKQYVLIASDDFDFEDVRVRAGVERLVKVLDADPTIHIASGRVNNQPYEALLEIEGDTVREIPGHRETRTVEDCIYHITDLTVNYSLIRTECLGLSHHKLHWDGGDCKIGGGEHGSLFLDAKRLGYGVAIVENVSIREYPYDYSRMHPSYPQFRYRAREPGRACLKARGINRWKLQDGQWEVC